MTAPRTKPAPVVKSATPKKVVTPALKATAHTANVPKAQEHLQRLGRTLMIRQPILTLRGRYAEGDHQLPRGDPRYMRALKHLRELANSNYIGLATTAPVERMTLLDFTIDGEVDDDCRNIWAANQMKRQAKVLDNRTAKYGLGYALVSPSEPGQKYPVITVEDSKSAIVQRDPARPGHSIAGLRLWHDDEIKHVVAVVYTPEGAYSFIGPPSSVIEGIKDPTNRLFGASAVDAFVFDAFVPNPDSVNDVCLVEYEWRPESGIIPEAECGPDVWRIQDRINQTLFDRMCITHYQAYKQRWASGLALPKGKRKGEKGSPFDPGMDMLWVTENKDAQFGEFQNADIQQILEAITADVAHLASITKTPAHYLMGTMANVSGETLTQAESGLVSKTRQRINSMGWSHEQVMKLCFAFMDDARATEPTLDTVWEDPQREQLIDEALAGFNFAQAGVPLPLLMKRTGWCEDDINSATKLVAAQEAKEQAQAVASQQMAQTHQLAMAKANPTGQGNPAAPGPSGPAKPALKKPTAGTKAPANKAPAKGKPN